MSLADLRQEYSLAGLRESDLEKDPFRQFDKWFGEAQAAQILEPNAMTLATATHDGRASARVVLLKNFDTRGFVFYTNFESRKGHELSENPHATLLFAWLPIERQVIVSGQVTKVAQEEALAYFHSRPRASQLGAWASQQSSVIPSRDVLDERLRALDAQYAERPIPLPPYWGGYRLAPESVEFWQGRRSRLHDRLRYRRESEGGEWIIERLSP
ncbi:pyridoxamine 5'-phosphate oxidase [Cephaloticoccus capnophilus]|uniref:Pyridoxamine 5'-phosphate oxidase n=1 Tax=Cephaloticoccus capnophilus TaxID=1548208 RepID=A0A139SK61_9BACT|nr:pyridoxamine 5'-phosphate oxidase [Cephaloticoccus capnophilus]KXU34972.1 pyridoxamine 5'-phosphate oxidase [Cephaloticoccus capnophilus]